jgi:hypothetical protein
LENRIASPHKSHGESAFNTPAALDVPLAQEGKHPMTEDMARLPGNNQPEEIKSPNRPPLNAARLRELMHYEPETGRVVRRTATRGHRAGAVAGCTRRDGYQVISIDGYRYLAHRLAWLYVHGAWPDGDLDHINANPSDNRIANLRAATSEPMESARQG